MLNGRRRLALHLLAFAFGFGASLRAVPAAAQSAPPRSQAPAPAAAIAAAPAFDELAVLIEEEHRRLTELAQEVERRTQALAALESQLQALRGALEPGQTAIRTADAPQSPSPAARPPEAPPAPNRFEFYGDTLVRLATLHQGDAGCSGCPDRTIERFRLRFGVEGRLAPGLRAVMGLSAGELNDPNSVYQTFGGNLGRKAASWDRGYISFRPPRAPWMELMAGKFPYPWVRSSMTFDVDFYPEGASERVSFDLKGRAKNVTAQAVQIVVNEQASGSDMQILGGQAGITFGLLKDVTTRALVTGMDVRHPEFILRSQLNGSDVGVPNTNPTLVREDGNAFYASGFRYANVILENTLQTRSTAWPIVLAGELQKNLRAAAGRDTGTSLRLDVGRQQRPGDWGFGWHWFRVEQDAIVSALGESDWRAPSNVVQHRIAANYTWHDHVQTLFTWYRGRTLDTNAPGALLTPGTRPGGRDPWANRLYFDVLYKF